MATLKDLVGPDKTVHFQFYRKGALYYRTSDNFEFLVPIEDCGDAEFLAMDKAMMFMRYIRKQLAVNAEGREAV
jgi:hypothetical protein